jgi:hypothetical protein
VIAAAYIGTKRHHIEQIAWSDAQSQNLQPGGTLRRMDHADKGERQFGPAYAVRTPPATVRTRYATVTRNKAALHLVSLWPETDFDQSFLINTG